MTPSASVPPPALELERVDVPAPADPDAVVVRDVNWRVATGERWLLSGTPGSGKTSLLQVAAGLIRATRGRHLLFGADLAELGETEVAERRARVGMVFGGGGRLFKQLTVAENLALPLLYHGRDRAGAGLGRIASVLEGLSLELLADRLPRDLPRRLAQRVALARALVLEPEVLLLDDVASGMPSADIDWWRQFVETSADGCCAVAPGLRTLVLAATEASTWNDLTDHQAVIESGGWRTVADAAAPGAGPGIASGGG